MQPSSAHFNSVSVGDLSARESPYVHYSVSPHKLAQMLLVNVNPNLADPSPPLLRACVRACVHACVRAYVCARARARARVCVCVCVCVCVRTGRSRLHFQDISLEWSGNISFSIPDSQDGCCQRSTNYYKVIVPDRPPALGHWCCSIRY